MSYIELYNTHSKESNKNILRYINAHNPHTLFITCCDARVSESKIINDSLGNVFVHRNIGNQIHNDDISFMTCLEYAIYHLKIICISSTYH